MNMTSTCELQNSTLSDASSDALPEKIANWIKLKNECLAAAKAFKAADEWMTAAREGGLLDSYYDELAEEYALPGVTFVRQETRRWRDELYSDKLRAAMAKEKEAGCPVTISWSARLK